MKMKYNQIDNKIRLISQYHSFLPKKITLSEIQYLAVSSTFLQEEIRHIDSKILKALQNIINKIKGLARLKRVRKPKFGCKPKVIFRFPEEIFTFEKNAFQVLGILPKQATIKTITKRTNELTNLIKAGLPFKAHIHGYCAVPWQESNPITENDISNAHARLQDNLKRINEELFWFRVEDGEDEAFKSLLDGNFEKAMDLWDSAKSSNSKYSAAQALHNLAVLKHTLSLKQEKTLTGNFGMNTTQIDNWKQIFGLWKNVHLNDKCWDYLQERVIYIDDPRIHVQHLRKTLPYMVLKINLEIAIAALRQELLEYSKQHIFLIKNSGFDSKDITEIERDFFNYFIREKKDFNIATDRFYSLANEISNYANYLIGEWNKIVNNVFASGAKREIKGLFEENARKLRDAKEVLNRATEIAKRGKEMFSLMEELCCNEDCRKQIKNDIEGLDKQKRGLGDAFSKLETWINRNLNTFRKSY